MMNKVVPVVVLSVFRHPVSPIQQPQGHRVAEEQIPLIQVPMAHLVKAAILLETVVAAAAAGTAVPLLPVRKAWVLMAVVVAVVPATLAASTMVKPLPVINPCPILRVVR